MGVRGAMGCSEVVGSEWSRVLGGCGPQAKSVRLLGADCGGRSDGSCVHGGACEIPERWIGNECLAMRQLELARRYVAEKGT